MRNHRFSLGPELLHHLGLEFVSRPLGRRQELYLRVTKLVEGLARAGYVEEAQLVFEKMLIHANHLGLYAEQIGSSGELLGNCPQALTHLALIRAAIRLYQELQREHPSRPKPRTTWRKAVGGA